MATRAALRTTARDLIQQTDEANTDFTNSELNAYIDEGVKFLATIVKWPRDKIDVQAVDGTGAYTLPTDAILIWNCYFGDVSVSGDVVPLDVMSEAELAVINPSWLDEHANAKGTPKRIILLDRTTIFIEPRPDADSSVSGKKIILTYVYSPATLGNDTAEPDLPLTFHDLVPIFVKHKCYSGKLKDSVLANAAMREVIEKAKVLDPIVTREHELQSMYWGTREDLEGDLDGGIVFT